MSSGKEFNMKKSLNALLVLAPLLLTGGTAVAGDDNEAIDEVYRAFFGPSADVEAIETLYRNDIIHIGRPDSALLIGKPDFIATNIEPFAAMVNSGQVEIEGRAYIVRRLIVGDMANDVGYLWMRLQQPDAEPIEQLQKFSWVFVKDNGKWRVATDFDAIPAPLSLLPDMQAERIVE
jgi:hypothetical protein